MKPLYTMFLLFLLPVFAFGQTTPSVVLTGKQGKRVVVSTDKEAYGIEEEIRISVFNNLDTGIFSHAASATPSFFIDYIEENNDQGAWEKILVRCQWPECDIDFDGPGELKAGAEKSFVWKPVQYVNKKNLPLGPGTYRMVCLYQIRDGRPDSKDWTWETIISNEFVVK